MLSIHLFLPSYYKKQECRIALVKSYLQFSYQILLALTDKLGLHNNMIFLPPAIIILDICVLLWEVSNHDLYVFYIKSRCAPKGNCTVAPLAGVLGMSENNNVHHEDMKLCTNYYIQKKNVILDLNQVKLS